MQDDELESGLRKTFNSKGFGFQYSVLEHCLNAGGPLRWKYAASEYPVSLNGKDLHIDFVLGCGVHLLVAECKRTKDGTWAFARGSRTTYSERPRADFLHWDQERRLYRVAKYFGNPGPPYDTGVPVKGDDKDFDHSLTQVFRGRSGLIEELAGIEGLRYGGGAVVPVIFTTATLVTTETKLSEADVATGDLPLTAVQSKQWIWYDYRLSRSLRPDVPLWVNSAQGIGPTKSQYLDRELAHNARKSVAIVRVEGLQDFLRALAISLEASADQID